MLEEYGYKPLETRQKRARNEPETRQKRGRNEVETRCIEPRMNIIIRMTDDVT